MLPRIFQVRKQEQPTQTDSNDVYDADMSVLLEKTTKQRDSTMVFKV